MGSILDESLVDDAVGRVDTVFHLAAAVGVELVIERPLESLWTNVVGTEVVLGAQRRTAPDAGDLQERE